MPCVCIMHSHLSRFLPSGQISKYVSYLYSALTVITLNLLDMLVELHLHCGMKHH